MINLFLHIISEDLWTPLFIDLYIKSLFKFTLFLKSIKSKYSPQFLKTIFIMSYLILASHLTWNFTFWLMSDKRNCFRKRSSSLQKRRMSGMSYRIMASLSNPRPKAQPILSWAPATIRKQNKTIDLKIIKTYRYVPLSGDVFIIGWVPTSGTALGRGCGDNQNGT